MSSPAGASRVPRGKGRRSHRSDPSRQPGRSQGERRAGDAGEDPPSGRPGEAGSPDRRPAPRPHDFAGSRPTRPRFRCPRQPAPPKGPQHTEGRISPIRSPRSQSVPRSHHTDRPARWLHPEADSPPSSRRWRPCQQSRRTGRDRPAPRPEKTAAPDPDPCRNGGGPVEPARVVAVRRRANSARPPRYGRWVPTRSRHATVPARPRCGGEPRGTSSPRSAGGQPSKARYSGVWCRSNP